MSRMTLNDEQAKLMTLNALYLEALHGRREAERKLRRWASAGLCLLTVVVIVTTWVVIGC